jgi:TorA maturation chaperone TorD
VSDAELWRALADDARMLSALHAAELTAERWNELRGLQFPANFALRLKSGASLAPLFAFAFGEWAATTPAPLEVLATDFAAIYLTHQYRASPYESVWLDEEGLAMQRPMFELRDRYRHHGLAVENWRTRSEDHLACQLDFLAWLLEGQVLGESTTFLDLHLLVWVDSFSRAVGARAETPFYVALARLTACWLDELRDVLAEALAEPRPPPLTLAERRRQLARGPQDVAAFAPAPSW